MFVAFVFCNVSEGNTTRKRETKMGFGEVICPKTEKKDALEENLGAVNCESANVEMQWNIIKKCVLNAMSYFVGKVESGTRKPWVTQEIISKMNERRKWKNVNNGEGSKN
jgi:hypothetical protein